MGQEAGQAFSCERPEIELAFPVKWCESLNMQTYYVVTAKSAFTRPHSYVCRNKEEKDKTVDELRSQQYLVEVEEVSEEDLTDEERTEIA